MRTEMCAGKAIPIVELSKEEQEAIQRGALLDGAPPIPYEKKNITENLNSNRQ